MTGQFVAGTLLGILVAVASFHYDAFDNGEIDFVSGHGLVTFMETNQ